MNTEGVVLPDELINHGVENIDLLTVMRANKETGTIMPIRAVRLSLGRGTTKEDVREGVV
ncbi:MAG: hypothetical protein K9M94_02520 [Spirochaetia bacterium]|nr:hypothetical protein [Spirochaetia bacterium]